MNENNTFRSVSVESSLSTYTNGITNIMIVTDTGEPLISDKNRYISGAIPGYVDSIVSVSASINSRIVSVGGVFS